MKMNTDETVQSTQTPTVEITEWLTDEQLKFEESQNINEIMENIKY
jgi:hypothetical protein